MKISLISFLHLTNNAIPQNIDIGIIILITGIIGGQNIIKNNKKIIYIGVLFFILKAFKVLSPFIFYIYLYTFFNFTQIKNIHSQRFLNISKIILNITNFLCLFRF